MEMAQVRKKSRARTALAIGASNTSPKKRRIVNINNTTSEDLMFSSSSFVQRTSTSASSGVPAAEVSCSSPTSDESPASCCSSNGFFDLDEKRIIKFSDPEVESAQAETSTCDCGDQTISRRKMSRSSELRSNSLEAESVEKKSTTPQKMPTESELEEFFAAAEKDIQKRFQCKYNYDILKDVPLEGRYEWVQLKP